MSAQKNTQSGAPENEQANPQAGDAGQAQKPADSAASADNAQAAEPQAGGADPEFENLEKQLLDETPDNSDPLGLGDTEIPFDEASAEVNLETDPESVEAQLSAAQEKADSHWERVLRMQADMENQRKRAQRDIENARKYALEGMINDLLPVKDSLEMGIAAARETDADASSIVEGSELTLKMMGQAFEKYNISEVNPVNEKFDPEFHQAMSMQEVEGKEPNTVTGVLQKGYLLNGRLLRPALVMVAK